MLLGWVFALDKDTSEPLMKNLTESLVASVQADEAASKAAAFLQAQVVLI
jgi:hypothetical protein